jgi:DNA-binding protein Fis
MSGPRRPPAIRGLDTGICAQPNNVWIHHTMCQTKFQSITQCIKQRVNQCVKQPINHLHNHIDHIIITQRVNQANKLSNNQTICQSIKQTMCQSIKQCVRQSITHSITQCFHQSHNASINQTMCRSKTQCVNQSKVYIKQTTCQLTKLYESNK